MKPALKYWVIRPGLILLTTVLVLAGVAFVVLSTQQQRLVTLALSQLNSQLSGELTLEESSLSLLKNFPYVSVALHNGKLYADKSRSGKPIARFDRLYVGFSASELLDQHYDIRRLFLTGGHMNLIQEADGTINLDQVMRAPETQGTRLAASDSSTAITLHLEKIVIRDVTVSYYEKSSGRSISAAIDRITSGVQMDSSELSVMLTGGMHVDVQTATDTLFLNKPVQLGLMANYDLKTQVLNLSNCHLKIQEAGFHISGQADLADTTHVNFHVKGERQDFKLVTAFVPDELKENLKPFQYDGHLHFEAVVNGHLTENSMPRIDVTFGCEEAWFLNTGANKKVDQLGFKGYYTNGEEHSLKTSEIHILNVNARPEKGVFRGHFVVRDFTNPRAVAKINSVLELKFLGEFLGIQDLKQMTGTIKLDMDFKEVHDLTLPEETLTKLKEGIQSDLVVENLSFRIPGYPHEVRDVNIHAEMRDGRVTVDSATLKIGESDMQLSGSISDVRRFLRDRDKPVSLIVNAASKQLNISNLLSYDTALARKWDEEVQGFRVNLALETTVAELLNPSPLPRGTFEMKNLQGTFKSYGHTVKNLGATVIITDTLLRLRDVAGLIDSSDFNFKGRISQYHLWFDDIKKGKTQVAFDFKSNRFAFRDVFTRKVRSYLPRGYRREQLTNVWLRSKIDLRYDTNFRFMKAKVSNVTAELKRHKLKLHEISGGIKFGSKILSFDTLRGRIGNTDFDISMKYYFKGIDRYDKEVANSLTFRSERLDIDEMSQYDLAPRTGKVLRDSTGKFIAIVPDSTVHAEAFNVFMIPFSDFNAQFNVAKVKYNRLWLKDVDLKLSMRKDQTLTVDTLMLKVAGGSVAMRGKFNGKNPEKISFRSRIAFDQVDLEKMMLKLDHFGQDVVVNKNIKGKVSGEIRSYVRVHPDLTPVVANSRAQMNLTIYDGSLVDFAPMQAMAGYFKDKNLRLIRFDTLQNKLTFNDGVLDIPEMDINSSLGYIQVSGRQSMDLTMEYYLRVPLKLVTKAGLSALFNGKPEEVDLNQVDQIEYIDKDKKIAFMNLKVTGTPDAFDVALGKQAKKKVL